MTDESKVSKRYRQLEREEPPRQLDDAILAAARRAVRTRPAPLVVPSGRRRWYFPLAAAAVIVLAVAVTMHVEREQPDAEGMMQAAQEAAPESTVGDARKSARPPVAAARPSEEQAGTPQAPKAGAKFEFYAPDPPLADLQKAPSAPAVPPPPSSAREAEPRQKPAIDGLARRDEAAPPQAKPAPAPDIARGRVQPQAGARAFHEPEARAALGAVGGLMYASPEQWLQGIADLRRQGRHEEADKALAEFRKRHPDYKIPEAMLEKVEKK
jgi:hypothetical protein